MQVAVGREEGKNGEEKETEGKDMNLKVPTNGGSSFHLSRELHQSYSYTCEEEMEVEKAWGETSERKREMLTFISKRSALLNMR